MFGIVMLVEFFHNFYNTCCTSFFLLRLLCKIIKTKKCFEKQWLEKRNLLKNISSKFEYQQQYVAVSWSSIKTNSFSDTSLSDFFPQVFFTRFLICISEPIKCIYFRPYSEVSSLRPSTGTIVIAKVKIGSQS